MGFWQIDRSPSLSSSPLVCQVRGTYMYLTICTLFSTGDAVEREIVQSKGGTRESHAHDAGIVARVKHVHRTRRYM